MKRCNYCQRELDDHQQICPYCGEQQEVATVRYQRTEYKEESYSEPKTVRAAQMAGSFASLLLGYFGYARNKWAGRNVQATVAGFSWLTIILYSVLTGLLANIVARDDFIGFIKRSLILFVFVMLMGLLSFIIAKLMERDPSDVFDYLYDFGNYLVLPMLLSLIGIVVGILKAHNVAQIILFTVIFFVFSALIAKLTKSHELNEPNHYPGLLILSTLFIGFFLVLTRLVF